MPCLRWQSCERMERRESYRFICTALKCFEKCETYKQDRRGQIHSLGYAFVDVKDIHDRNKRTTKRLNSYLVKGKPIFVEIADEEPDRVAYKNSSLLQDTVMN